MIYVGFMNYEKLQKNQHVLCYHGTNKITNLKVFGK